MVDFIFLSSQLPRRMIRRVAKLALVMAASTERINCLTSHQMAATASLSPRLLRNRVPSQRRITLRMTARETSIRSVAPIAMRVSE